MKPSREEIYRWEKIIKPSPVNDVEIQEQIEREYQSDMALRNQRLAQLSQRCNEDREFAKRFRRKIEETNYPATEMVLILQPDFK